MMMFMMFFILSKGLSPTYAYDFGSLLQKPSHDKAQEFYGLFESAKGDLKNEEKLNKTANKTIPDYEKERDEQKKLADTLNAHSEDELKASGEREYDSNEKIGAVKDLLEKEPDEIHSFHGLFEGLKAVKAGTACKTSRDPKAPGQKAPFLKKEKIREAKKEVEYKRVTCQSESSKIIACTNTLTHLTCKNRGNCSAGGIVRGSESARLQALSLNYPHLEVGTLSTIYDKRRCKIINETVSFQIKSLALIGEFRLLHMSYSDWIRLELNGHEIVNTTGGSGSFTMEDTVQHFAWMPKFEKGHQFCLLRSGDKKQTCNTKEFYTDDLNLDLKPFLKEGLNHLKIDLAFGNSGQLYLKFFAPERCCTDFDEHWSETCLEK